MHKISSLILATALILAAGVGTWIVLTATDVKAAAKATHAEPGGRTPIRGGHYVMQSVF